MYKIIKKRILADKIALMDIEAPRTARYSQPGQFVVVRKDEFAERIPLTICDYNREKGSVTIVIQAIGASSEKLFELEEGQCLEDFIGPLGVPSEFVNEPIEDIKKRKYLFVAGGLGTAPVYPQVKYLHSLGVSCDCIIGAKTKELLIMEAEMKEVVDNLYITTDDGSYGEKGLVTDVIKRLIEEENKSYDIVVAIGPMIMMKFVSLTTKTYNLKTIVSMNPIMVDGTGMCGCCRVMVGDEVKFACIDGPEFDGHLIDFDQAMHRAQMYKSFEGRAKLKALEGETHSGGCVMDKEVTR